jgi:hypothetical protein
MRVNHIKGVDRFSGFELHPTLLPECSCVVQMSKLHSISYRLTLRTTILPAPVAKKFN